MCIRDSYYRPQTAAVAERYREQFPALNLFTVADVFGGWARAQAVHFKDGGTFDQIYQPGR